LARRACGFAPPLHRANGSSWGKRTSEAAAQRVREALPQWVRESLAREEIPGDRDPARQKDVASRVARDVTPLMDREIEDTLRAAGLDDKLWNPEKAAEEVREIRQRFDLDGAARRETVRQIESDGRNR
jgi:hypothetical protein